MAEERPSWGCVDFLAERMAAAEAVLDLRAGGGGASAALPVVSPLLAEAGRP